MVAGLTALQVRNAGEGRHMDRDGLFLRVRATGSRAWVLRVVVTRPDGKPGKRQDFGLGSTDDLTLIQARDKAAEWRALARDGLDPRQEGRRVMAERVAERGLTFEAVAADAYADLKGGWRNPKHSAQWINTLTTYAFPIIGTMPIADVDVRAIVRVLTPIWQSKPETARRVRQRIGTVLDYAHAHELRPAEAPMRSLAKVLPRQTTKAEHHSAVPYGDAPTVLAELQSGAGTAGRLALEFTVLTAARTGEVRSMLWQEVDLKARTWTVPADRMKAGRVHTVPLTSAALDVLTRAVELFGKDDARPVFPGTTAKGEATARGLSNMTMAKVQGALRPGTTVHGWRSTFRDWTAEQTGFAGELAELSLAHVNPNRVEAAYRRGDLLEKRRALMEAWASYLSGRAGNVTDMNEGRKAS